MQAKERQEKKKKKKKNGLFVFNSNPIPSPFSFELYPILLDHQNPIRPDVSSHTKAKNDCLLVKVEANAEKEKENTHLILIGITLFSLLLRFNSFFRKCRFGRRRRFKIHM